MTACRRIILHSGSVSRLRCPLFVHLHATWWVITYYIHSAATLTARLAIDNVKHGESDCAQKIRHWTDVDLMLAQRLRRWLNMKSTLAQGVVFSGFSLTTRPTSAQPCGSIQAYLYIAAQWFYTTLECDVYLDNYTEWMAFQMTHVDLQWCAWTYTSYCQARIQRGGWAHALPFLPHAPPRYQILDPPLTAVTG